MWQLCIYDNKVIHGGGLTKAKTATFSNILGSGGPAIADTQIHRNCFDFLNLEWMNDTFNNVVWLQMRTSKKQNKKHLNKRELRSGHFAILRRERWTFLDKCNLIVFSVECDLQTFMPTAVQRNGISSSSPTVDTGNSKEEIKKVLFANWQSTVVRGVDVGFDY